MLESGPNWERQQDGSILYRARQSAPTRRLNEQQFQQIAGYRRREALFAVVTALPVAAIGMFWLFNDKGGAVALSALVAYVALNLPIQFWRQRRVSAVLAGAPVATINLDLSQRRKRGIERVLGAYSNRTLLGSIIMFSAFALGSLFMLIEAIFDLSLIATKPAHPLASLVGLAIFSPISILYLLEFRRRKRLGSDQ